MKSESERAQAIIAQTMNGTKDFSFVDGESVNVMVRGDRMWICVDGIAFIRLRTLGGKIITDIQANHNTIVERQFKTGAEKRRAEYQSRNKNAI